MILGDKEYAEEIQDCTTYGRFTSEEETLNYLDKYHSNPGAYETDDSGKRPPPTTFVTSRAKARCKIP